MVWNYLSQFWEAVVDVGEYTIEFFQSIGNAVAGAIGGLFDNTFHLISDIGLIFNWFSTQLKDIFLGILQPVSYIFNLLKSFWGTAFTTPTTPELNFTFPQGVLDVFNAIPHWSTVSTVLAGIIILVMGIGIIKLFLHS